MSKTVKQALKDAVHYPIPVGFIENAIIERQLNEADEYDYEMSSPRSSRVHWLTVSTHSYRPYRCMSSDKSVGTLTDKDKERLLIRINALYNSIGEEPVLGQPMVYFGG